MAEMMQKTDKGKRRKLPIPRVDLTPMVDLGFLLITFFMFTTSLAKPHAMQVYMPDKEPTDRSKAWPKESTITLIPTRDNKTVCYKYNELVEERTEIYRTNSSALRDVIMKASTDARSLPSHYSAEAHKLHVMIKPNDDCSYENIVNLLDEMTINDVRYYTILDITEDEQKLVTKKLQ